MAEAEYWRFTVARDCQKKNTSETHSECRLLEADVRAFYHEHDASKLHKVSTVLFRYKGK